MNMQIARDTIDGRIVYTYPEQPQMQVEVILASQGPNQRPIYTIRMRYPRIIHGEIMTHRLFSRNARSSRAVPVKTMLLETTTIPFIPWHWGKNQRGMQASEECNELVRGSLPDAYENEIFLTREQAWLEARDAAVRTAKAYMDAGYHKQIPNRLLEPFSWIDTLITATDWDNFLWLREHGAAEPHLRDLARLVHAAIIFADVQKLEPGEWHMPYIEAQDLVALASRPETGTEDFQSLLNKISAARCARISYKPFDGNASYERELDRYDSLVSDDRVHASPLEHQATPDEKVFFDHVTGSWSTPEHHGNFDGYIQYRKTVPNEAKMEGVL